MRKLLTGFCLCAMCSGAQTTDSLFVYDILMGQLQRLGPVAVDTTLVSGCTSTYTGSLPGTSPITHSLPVTNVIPNGTFTYPQPAAGFFDTEDYPLRTTVKIISFQNGIAEYCTGNLVGEDLMVSLGFCFLKQDPGFLISYPDSVQVLPAFNNGVIPVNIGPSRGRRLYFEKSSQTTVKSILLQLDKPIGAKTGWLGVAFEPDTFYFGRVFHKFSYPAVTSPFDSTKVYNGDTMYYEYGQVQVTSSGPWLACQGSSGVPGQGGSGLLYEGPGGFGTHGAGAFSSGFMHIRNYSEEYFILEYVKTHFVTGLPEIRSGSGLVSVYPNPCQQAAIVDLGLTAQNAVITLINSVGKLVWQSETKNVRQVAIPCSILDSGIYMILAGADGRTLRGKLLVAARP